MSLFLFDGDFRRFSHWWSLFNSHVHLRTEYSISEKYQLLARSLSPQMRFSTCCFERVPTDITFFDYNFVIERLFQEFDKLRNANPFFGSSNPSPVAEPESSSLQVAFKDYLAASNQLLADFQQKLLSCSTPNPCLTLAADAAETEPSSGASPEADCPISESCVESPMVCDNLLSKSVGKSTKSSGKDSSTTIISADAEDLETTKPELCAETDETNPVNPIVFESSVHCPILLSDKSSHSCPILVANELECTTELQLEIDPPYSDLLAVTEFSLSFCSIETVVLRAFIKSIYRFYRIVWDPGITCVIFVLLQIWPHLWTRSKMLSILSLLRIMLS